MTMTLKPVKLAVLAALLLPCAQACAGQAAPASEVIVSSKPLSSVPKGPSLSDVYRVPDGARDPFVPVPPQTQTASGPRTAKSPRARDAKFNLNNAELSGIVTIGKERQAVLSDKETGASFILHRGFIYDWKRRPVEGYSGVLEEKQATIYGPADAVKTLKLPERSRNGKRS